MCIKTPIKLIIAAKKKAQKVCQDFQIEPPSETITEKAVLITAKVKLKKSEQGC